MSWISVGAESGHNSRILHLKWKTSETRNEVEKCRPLAADSQWPGPLHCLLCIISIQRWQALCLEKALVLFPVTSLSDEWAFLSEVLKTQFKASPLRGHSAFRRKVKRWIECLAGFKSRRVYFVQDLLKVEVETTLYVFRAEIGNL